MLKHFLNWLLFANTMFFAAGAVSVGAGDDAGAGDGAGDGNGDGGAGDADIYDGGGAGDDDAGAGEHDDDAALDADIDGAETEAQKAARGEDRETAEFKGQVSKRLVGLKQKSPKFAEALKESPELQSTIEATFRRESAYKEIFPTVAEARQVREAFPNGMRDVQALFDENNEVAELDRSFYGRDAQGNFTGHSGLVNNLFTNDRDATVALFKTIPREWHRLDPDSYNEVMGNIVGATLQSAQIGEWLTELRETATAAKQDVLAKELGKMLSWVTNFKQKKGEASEEDRGTRARREQLERQTREFKSQEFTRFKADFTSQSRNLQNGILRKHPAIAEMLTSKAIPEAKKSEIVEKVRKAIEGHLGKSHAFMAKLRPLYNAGKLKDTLDLQRAAWQYPWIVNKYVRQVMAAETPGLLKNNRERARGSAEPARRTAPANRGTERRRENERTGPYQVGKQWFKKDGTPFTSAEVLRGMHLTA